MSLFNRALRPPPIASDDAIERYVVALRSQVQPDRSSGADCDPTSSTDSWPLARGSEV